MWAAMVSGVASSAQAGAQPQPEAANVPAPEQTTCTVPAAARLRWSTRVALRHLGVTAALLAAGLAAIWQANVRFAPEMYATGGPKVMADALGRGKSYAVFDLNINIRELRDHHIGRLDYTPDVVVLGASHWQEAHAGLVRHKRMYNAHIHRDYWEDPLGMVELLVSHNRLPRQIIIAVRDNQFTPIERRRDFLWLPGIPFYRDMARRLDIEAQSTWSTLPTVRWGELLSLHMLHGNVLRWYTAPTRPHATDAETHPTLDLLRPDGSIVWSDEHRRAFTPARTARLSAEFAAQKSVAPPRIEARGVAAFEALLEFLARRNVEVFLAHPPYNPDFWERVQGTPYMQGLHAVERLTLALAEKHGARVIGSFDPAAVGCDRSHYIDAEHANPDCLGRIFDQYTALDTATPAVPAQPVVAAAAGGREAAAPDAARRTGLPLIQASVGTPPPPAVGAAASAGDGAAAKSNAKDKRKANRAERREAPAPRAAARSGQRDGKTAVLDRGKQ